MVAFASARFSSKSRMTIAKLLRYKADAVNGVKALLSLSLTRPGLASTHCRSSASLISSKSNTSAAAAAILSLAAVFPFLPSALAVALWVVCVLCGVRMGV